MVDEKEEYCEEDRKIVANIARKNMLMEIIIWLFVIIIALAIMLSLI